MLKRSTGTQEALGAGKGPVLTGLGNEKQALDKQSQGIWTGVQCEEKANKLSSSKSLPFLLNFKVLKKSS